MTLGITVPWAGDNWDIRLPRAVRAGFRNAPCLGDTWDMKNTHPHACRCELHRRLIEASYRKLAEAILKNK